MIKKIRFSYSWLILISIPVFLVAMVVFRAAPANQFRAVLGLCALYLGGAILHHWQDKSLTLELIIEYVLMAGLVLLIFQGLMI